MLEQAVDGLISNLGVFAPAAALGYWVIRTQQKEKEEARADLKEARGRVDILTDSVIKTMADLGNAIRGQK